MECKPRVPSKPPPHVRMLVGGVVVEDDVHGRFSRHLRFNCIQKADELLVTMALHATADDLAFEHVESGEQRCCPVAFIVVGHRSGAALLHRQTRLGAIQRLDLRFLIDRENDGMSGWINVEPDNVTQLVDELRIVGELELLHFMRLKAVSAPNALDGTGADADCFRHQGGGPVGRLGGRFGLGERHDAFRDLRPERRNARTARLVAQEAGEALLHEAFLPAPDTSLRLAGLAHDVIGAGTGGTQQHDLGPPNMLLRRVAIPHERLQAAAVNRLERDGNSGSHAPDLHAPSRGNPSQDSNVRFAAAFAWAPSNTDALPPWGAPGIRKGRSVGWGRLRCARSPITKTNLMKKANLIKIKMTRRFTGFGEGPQRKAPP